MANRRVSRIPSEWQRPHKDHGVWLVIRLLAVALTVPGGVIGPPALKARQAEGRW